MQLISQLTSTQATLALAASAAALQLLLPCAERAGAGLPGPRAMAGYESREPWSAGGVSPKPVILTQTTPLVERACLKSGLTFDELIA